MGTLESDTRKGCPSDTSLMLRRLTWVTSRRHRSSGPKLSKMTVQRFRKLLNGKGVKAAGIIGQSEAKSLNRREMRPRLLIRWSQVRYLHGPPHPRPFAPLADSRRGQARLHSAPTSRFPQLAHAIQSGGWLRPNHPGGGGARHSTSAQSPERPKPIQCQTVTSPRRRSCLPG